MEAPLSAWRRRAQIPALLVALCAIALSGVVIYSKTTGAAAAAAEVHGSATRPPPGPPFDLSELTIPADQVRGGGPPKDGIPALTDPAFVSAVDAAFLNERDEVIGVTLGGDARAYPLRLLDSHEVVNDRVGGLPIAVTYCPLCDSSAVFDRRLGGSEREFGVSGLLYNSNVLVYDRQDNDADESLWTQMGAVGVSGAAGGQPLARLPMEVASWASWRERHPETLVLSLETGHKRAYDRSVYAAYFSGERLMFPVERRDQRLPAKTPVLGLASGSQRRAYVGGPGAEPSKRRETLGQAEFDLVVDERDRRLRVENVDGSLEWCYSYWFAWAAFNPETEFVDLRPPGE